MVVSLNSRPESNNEEQEGYHLPEEALARAARGTCHDVGLGLVRVGFIV